MIVGHAVKEEGGVSGVGPFHLVPYGVPIVAYIARSRPPPYLGGRGGGRGGRGG